MNAVDEQREALPLISAPDTEDKEEQDEWVSTVPADVLQSLPQSEINRQRCAECCYLLE